MVRIFSLIVAIIAVLAFAIGLILAGSSTASTAADSVRWIDGGLLAFASSFGLYVLSTISDRQVP